MKDLRRTRVAWVSPQLSYLVASTRYRCFYPAFALRDHHIDSVFFRTSSEVLPLLKEIDAIVFVKLLDSESLKLAGLAKDQGVKVLIDLCDNVVVANYPMSPDFHPALRLAGIGAFADAIVVPSPALVEALKPLVRPGLPFVVIPDQIETEESIAAAAQLQKQSVSAPVKRSLNIVERVARFGLFLIRDRPAAMAVLKGKISTAYRLNWMRLTAVARSQGTQPRISSASGLSAEVVAERVNPVPHVRPKSVLWFGNFGAPHSDFGMLALMLAAPALEAVCRDIPLELTVISNKRLLFDNAISQIGVPTRYVEWSENTVFEKLKDADVCLLPFGMDAFSLTKSANRAVLALEYGVPVVTTRLSSMEPLEGVVAFDDWEAGLRRFLGPQGNAEREAAIAAASPILEENYSAKAIGEAWAALICKPTTRPRPGYASIPAAGEVAVLLDAPESFELLMSVIDVLRNRRDVLLRVLVTPNALAASTRALIERQIIPYALDEKAIFSGDDRILRTVNCILTTDGHGHGTDLLTDAVNNIAVERGVRAFVLGTGADGTGILARSLPVSETAQVLNAGTASSFTDLLFNHFLLANTRKSTRANSADGWDDNVLDVHEMALANQSQQSRTDLEKLTGD
ncbi:hypothetical protein PDO_4414 [Rhizobium sp. PDO1-076]|uniref:hypothetical protein n=1 Tax=Rhizobium sp. PDO1-076 TaxID=1125979 RepID=UPI00024E2569|nr:hypothetical protein [Rhizobium sp. PDO1-076]EHS53134.1 hypothetical protein PDO_4414 [Rhizobium sp. PDO1-076]